MLKYFIKLLKEWKSLGKIKDIYFYAYHIKTHKK